ncbi:hypothetical protein FKV73_01300 [Weissella paramesenteroides]|nr:hypothetical protein FKV79_00190 [Weissella paramesenteroides]KAA8438940.1 hypothetical protein FKV73_01300 [Weissella paramesenteroides]
MRYANYSEDATLEHFDEWTVTVGKQLDRITDPVLKDTLYELLHATLNYVDREDENAMGATNHVESKLEELDDEVGELYVVNDYEERIADLERQVAKKRG